MPPHPDSRLQYSMPLTAENLRAVFSGAADFSERTVYPAPDSPVHIFSIDGLVSSAELAEFVVKPLLRQGEAVSAALALARWIPGASGHPVETLDDGAAALTNGFCLLLAGDSAAAIEVRGGDRRSVSPPTVENTVKGPKDAFTETLRTNTALLRRHLRTPELRLSEEIVGRRSRTAVTVCSIGGLTDERLVEAVEARLKTIDIDGLLSPAAVEEYLTGSRKTAFPLLLYTERPDRFAAGLLSGRVGLLADGLPLGYLLPCRLADFLTSQEDLGGNYVAASAVKLLRWLSFFLALALPGLFAAVTLYHQEMIPLALLRAIRESRQAVPLSAGAEVILLLIAFELLQEAGLQLPQNLGQAVSIIGGLVVGTAAVEASLISPASLIAVAAAGVCSFTIPQRDLGDAVRVWRFLIALGGLAAGLAGVTMAALLLLIHLSDLSSLGLPYLSPPPEPLRARLSTRKRRDAALHPKDARNQR